MIEGVHNNRWLQLANSSDLQGSLDLKLFQVKKVQLPPVGHEIARSHWQQLWTFNSFERHESMIEFITYGTAIHICMYVINQECYILSRQKNKTFFKFHLHWLRTETKHFRRLKYETAGKCSFVLSLVLKTHLISRLGISLLFFFIINCIILFSHPTELLWF